MRVLLIDDTRARARVLRQALQDAGFEVVQAAAAPLALMKAVEREAPDVIIIDVDSPSRDVLEHIVVTTQAAPRPIVMFASDPAEDKIREAVKAGVSAYVVDGLDAARVKPIIDVACARFEEFQRLRGELAEARQSLSDRKLIERAKGILMRRRDLSEEDAFAALRGMAMDRKQRLADTARSVIEAAELLG
ncbi:MAG TPA: ANTAR domain-containing protein [Burkholderiales bacterium]